MTEMIKSSIVPACLDHQRELIDLVRQKKAYGRYNASLEEHFLDNISKLSANLLFKLNALEDIILESKPVEDREILEQAVFYHDKVYTSMSDLRLVIDELETLVARKHWPFPTYAEVLYSII